ncbi:MAG TPA: NmrA/HSCARG family protein [Ignavibacteriaceae bacterium]|nr:NmrA/HSCARG family protein [Ignavibacteriaceae bacterium]
MLGKKIIAILGATGAQGGGLANAILNDSNREFSVRAITRNANSDKAKELSKKGAEVVEADVANKDDLEKAFSGCYGAYCVTFYWEHMSPEKELAHAKNMAEAAKTAGLKHVIWSTLEDTRKWVPLGDDRMPTLMEKYKVPHFDAKGTANKFFEEAGLPTTYLNTSFYWDNFIHFGMGPKKGEDGKYAVTLPMGDKRLPGMAAEDIGKCAYGIFKKGTEFIGKSLGIVGEKLTGKQMAESFSISLGKDVAYNEVPPEIYRGFGFPGADDLGNMFQFNRDFEKDFCDARDIELSKSLNPELQSFNDWLEKNKRKIPIE